MVSTQNTFIRNVQITGDVTNGDVYIAGMDEGGGGFPHNNTNLISNLPTVAPPGPIPTLVQSSQDLAVALRAISPPCIR